MESVFLLLLFSEKNNVRNKFFDVPSTWNTIPVYFVKLVSIKQLLFYYVQYKWFDECQRIVNFYEVWIPVYFTVENIRYRCQELVIQKFVFGCCLSYLFDALYRNQAVDVLV